ncbi:MAG: hypothetical protein WDW38_000567 [Sanguina aurantia]
MAGTWVKTQITAADAVAAVASTGAFLLDIRDKDVVKEEGLVDLPAKSLVKLPFSQDEDSEEESELDFAESFKELDLPKEAQIILLDSDGSEAAAAVEALYKGGVPRSRKILFVTGGFSGTDGWKVWSQSWHRAQTAAFIKSLQRLGKGGEAESSEEEEKPVAPVAVTKAVKAVAPAVKKEVVVPAKSEVKVAAAVAKVKEVEAVPLIKADPAENVREARAWIENWKASRDDPPPPEKEVPENVKEARAWIENWKATKDAPPAPENEVPENVKEARAWIANWKASKDVPPAPEKEAPENVKEARAWIANWKEAAAAAAPAKEVEKALPAKPATAVEPEYVKEGDNWVLNYKAFLRPAAAKAAVAAAPAAQAKPVPENVKETRDWIAGWKAKLAAESAASNGTGMQSADVRQ